MDKSVFLAACQSYEGELVARQVGRIFEWYGGAEKLLEKGKNILVKPNLLMARQPDGATTAHPEVVYAVCVYLIKAGANVTIADSPGGAYNEKALQKVYTQCGMAGAAERSGAMLNFDVSSREMRVGGRVFDIITPAIEVDAIVNVAKLKTHMLTYYTGAVKNLFGTVAGTAKRNMHAKYPKPESFCQMLVDLCERRVPEFSIIDAVMCMEGDGPSAGEPRELGALIASPNPYAADLAAMDLAGLSPQKSPVHRIAAGRGFVPARAGELEMAGDKIDRPSPFKEAGSDKKITSLVAKITRSTAPYPVFGEKCVGCGDCAAVCPAHAIEIAEKRAKLNRKKCIRCFCCHELCPVQAIHTGK